MKQRIIKFLFVFFALNFMFWLYLFYLGRYKEIELTYLGSADGTWDTYFFCTPSYALKQNFLYCNFGYGLYGPGTAERCNLHNFDFNLEFRESKRYVYSGVPIDKLEYCHNLYTKNGEYYSRATFSKDRFQEGRYYFYEIDNIRIGSMALEIWDEEFDREFEILNVFLIIFSSLGLGFTGWYCLKTRKRISAVHSKNE